MAHYIHFEGMDLAGKSTASRLLSEGSEEPWEIRSNSLDPDNAIFQLANTLRLSKDQIYSAETMGPLYVAASLADIERFTRPEVNTVQDSTIIVRSMAWHTINNTPGVVEAFRPLLPKFRLFDKSFVFTASIAARQQRLEQRIAEAPETVDSDDLAVIRKPERFLAMESTLLEIAKTAFDAVVIDTTDMSPSDVQTAIGEELQRL
jgi:thymidylate kinase